MLMIEQDKIERLKSGDFSDACLNHWFVNHAFDYIFAIVEGCDKNKDDKMLNFVSIYAQQLMRKPNANGWDKKSLKELIKTGAYPVIIDEMTYEELIEYYKGRIIKTCEKILEKVIIVCCKNNSNTYFNSIVDKLSTSENENIRLYCCANVDYEKLKPMNESFSNAGYTNFLNDPSPRVRKVANIRYNFYKKFSRLDYKEQQRIIFLTDALEKGAIDVFDGDALYEKEDKMTVLFTSLLFNKGHKWRYDFDKDIVYTIQDKKILADVLNELIKENDITLNEDMVPSYFIEKKEGPVLKKKQ